jgi:hypothetical protein
MLKQAGARSLKFEFNNVELGIDLKRVAGWILVGCAVIALAAMSLAGVVR